MNDTPGDDRPPAAGRSADETLAESIRSDGLDRSTLDLSGRRIGNYHLLRRLGRGGMATVYVALQESLNRQVAFKVLHADLALDTQYLQRFQNEARAVAALAHPHIVQIHEVGCVDGVHFLVQELVDGLNLQQHLAQYGPMTPSQAIGILWQVASALAHAGERGVVHRDIKPENILITTGGTAKVVDFGLARQTLQPATAMTQAGLTMGTPYYMSPEQVQGLPLDPRSDLYSLGVTGYQLLTGKLPFQAETAVAVAAQHLHDHPRRVDELRGDIPKRLADMIERLMAKRPEDRFASGALLQIRLEELRSTAPAGDSQSASWSDRRDPNSVASSGAGRPSLAATRELQRVLTAPVSDAPAVWSSARRGWLLPLSAIAVGLLVGTLVARAMRPADPLAVTQGDLASEPIGVERQASAQEQYFQAYLENSEEAWQAVISYFPPHESPQNALYAGRAREQLARWYLERERWSELLQVARDLSASDDTELEFRAVGVACEILVWHARGEYGEVRRMLVQGLPLSGHLPNDLRRRLQGVAAEVRRPGR